MRRTESFSHRFFLQFGSSPFIGLGAFVCCPLKCVKVAKGVVLNYEFEKECAIHEIDLAKNE
jgi:hypothetical protein